MSDYRRVVSYIYRYENGEKRTNEGFARLEIRNGQLKVTIHITSPSVRDARVSVYFYQRQDSNIAGIPLGEMVFHAGEGDFKGVTEAASIMGSGASLEDTGGMILTYVPDLFFATEWDDHPVTKADLLGLTGVGEAVPDVDEEELVPIESVKALVSDAEELDAEKTDVEKNGEEKIDLGEPKSEVSPVDSESGRDSEMEKPLETASKNSEEENETKLKREAVEYFTYGQYGKLEPIRTAPVQTEETASTPPVQTVPPAQAASVRAADVQAAPETVCVNPPQGIAANMGLDASHSAGANNREAMICSADEKPLARTILDSFPKMTPFQDSEISECVRISPQNIGLLPMDAWVLGHNSFLQHGYYNHRHLIFAKKYTRSGIMYLLGVPGYFTPRERNMARMFGFNNFKSVKMRPVQSGEFGYWYVPIVF